MCITVRLEDSEVSQQDLIVLEEHIEQNKKSLDEAKKELEVLELMKEALEYAINDLAGDFQKNVVTMIEQDLPTITDRRYSDVQIDESFA
jgi:hypothetical protein